MKNTILMVITFITIATASLQAKIIVKDPKKLYQYDFSKSTITNADYFWGQDGENFIKFYFDDGKNMVAWLIGTKHNGYDITVDLQLMIADDYITHFIIDEKQHHFNYINGKYLFFDDGSKAPIAWGNLIYVETELNFGFLCVNKGFLAKQTKKERLAAPARLQKKYQQFLTE